MHKYIKVSKMKEKIFIPQSDILLTSDWWTFEAIEVYNRRIFEGTGKN